MSLRAAIDPYVLRFRRPIPSPFGPIAHRRGWLLRLEDADGQLGLGDAAGWSGFGAPDDAIAADLQQLTQAVSQVDAAEAFDETWLDAHCRTAEGRYALELALLDLEGRRTDRPVASLLHDASPAYQVATHELIGLQGELPEGHLKLKVGVDLDAELARVVAIAETRPEAKIRLDAGGRWTEEEAAAALRRFAAITPIELVEQPVAPGGDLDVLVRLRALAHELGLAIALDEGVVRLEDFEAALAASAADAVVLKPMFLGGLRRTLALARRAEAAGLKVIITHALESAVGRTGAAHLAAGLPGVHGLSNHLAEDVAVVPSPRQGRLTLPPGAGLGVRLRAPIARAADLPHPIISAAAAHPERPALISDDGSRLTYGELADTARRYAAAFARDGVGPGVHVGLSGSPGPAWIGALHGLGLLGAAVVPLPAGEAERRATIEAARPQLIVSVERDLSRWTPRTRERFWPLHETRLIVCSSGSTGPAQATPLTTAQLVFSAFASATRLGLASTDRWLCCLPLHHVGGASILFRSAFYGTAVELHPRFDPVRANEAIDAGVTLVSLVPEMLRRLLDAREAPFPTHLRALLIGGAALEPELRERALSRGAPIAETWGMTEAASQVATQSPGEAGPWLAPLPFTRIERGEDGRLAVAGPLVGQRLATRDLGDVKDGRVRITGRADDVIISGGEKIQPRAVEAVLRTFDGIRDAVVIGVPSPRWGARPVAFVEGRPQPLEALIAHLRAQLPRFAVPDRFIWRDAFPRSALGKVRRGELQRELEAPAEGTHERPHPDRRPEGAAP